MVDSPSPSAAAAVSRRLTVTEVTTIRAALRAWTVIDVTEAGLAEVGGDAVLSDGEIERLLVELGAEAVAVTVTRFDPHEGRRI